MITINWPDIKFRALLPQILKNLLLKCSVQAHDIVIFNVQSKSTKKLKAIWLCLIINVINLKWSNIKQLNIHKHYSGSLISLLYILVLCFNNPRFGFIFQTSLVCVINFSFNFDRFMFKIISHIPVIQSY